MRRLLLLLSALVILGPLSPARPAGAARVEEPLQVVTTIPDLADIAREVGGPAVEVRCIARGLENLHSVRLRPSHMVMVSRAELFVQVGLALEHG
jgi:ABC-type Zn uptake system ZnuABC Zn-binding protein ZnuA